MSGRRKIPSSFERRPIQSPGMMRHGPLPGLGPPPGHRPFEALPRPELLENKIAYQAAEIKQLTGDNHRLAATHVDLRQDLLAAEEDLQRLKAHMRSIQTESDIQMRGLLDKIAKREADIEAGEGVKKELQKAHMEAQTLVAAQQELTIQIRKATEELQKARLDVEKLPGLHAELDSLRREHHRLRSTFEYEKGLNVEEVEQMKAMEKNLIGMAREVERLRDEVSNAEKRVHGSVKWGPISKKQEDEVEWMRAQLSETERECGNLVTQKNLLESGLLQGMAGIIRGSTKVAVDIDEAEMQKQLRESRAKKAEKGAGKRPRDDDEGWVADVLGKRKALEEAHQHVMGSGLRLPTFDLQAPPKLPFGMEDVFAEGVEKMDFDRLRQQKKEVNLAMHRQEVPLVNVFLEGVKSDPEALARTPASSFIDRAQKTILTSAYAFGEMYVSMAKADKEIQRLKRRDEMAKSKMAEAQEAIGEKNALLLQKAALAKEVEELKRSKAEEVAAARVEAIESFRTSEELKSYIMDWLVDEQLRWEDRLVRFNPSVEINFDTSGEPPAQSPPADASVPTPEAEPAIEDAPSTES